MKIKNASLELRQRAANRIVDVMVRDEEETKQLAERLSYIEISKYEIVLNRN